MSDHRLVVFDLGGVLVRLREGWRLCCEAAGVDVSDATDIDPNDWMDAIEEHQVGAIDIQTYASRLSAAVDGAIDVEQIIAVHRAWTIWPYDGALELIHALRAAGRRVVCLSNTNDEHVRVMNDYPAVAALDERYMSNEMGLRKPDAAIYEALMRREGFAPHEIVFFDDAEENVVAARGVGWHAVHVDPADPITQMCAELGVTLAARNAS